MRHPKQAPRLHAWNNSYTARVARATCTLRSACAARVAPTFGTDPNQPNALACNELESPVNVCDLVNPHLALGLSRGDLVSGDHLQEFQQFKAVAEVFIDVIDEVALSCLPQMRVAPGSEGLTGKRSYSHASTTGDARGEASGLTECSTYKV